jgi:hypothetical protein
MLSPHEVSTLMLVKEAPDRVEPGRPELGALRERQLVVIEPLECGMHMPRVTPRGDAVLRAIGRAR